MADIDESGLSDSAAFSPTDYIDEGKVTQRHILGFAKVILSTIAFMYFLASISEFLKTGNEVFKSCQLTLPSLATLVIGYYFGSTK